MKYTTEILNKLKKKRKETKEKHRTYKNKTIKPENWEEKCESLKKKRKKAKKKYIEYKQKYEKEQHLFHCIQFVERTIAEQEASSDSAFEEFQNNLTNIAIATGHNGHIELIVKAVKSYHGAQPNIFEESTEEIHNLDKNGKFFFTQQQCIHMNKRKVETWKEELENM